MVALRRKIIAPLILQLLVIAAVSFILAFLSKFIQDNLALQLGIGIGIFAISMILVLIIKIHIPLQIVTQEMKALLTGKTYRKITTNGMKSAFWLTFSMKLHAI